MTLKSQIGKIGEDIACQYLKNKGHTIIDRNYREPWGEIDIISRSPDKTLIFVEVKTMRGSEQSELKPEDNLTGSKLQKLKKTAQLYTGANPEQINPKKGWQIDLIAITIPDRADIWQPLEKLYKDCVINYYENI